MRHWLCRAEWNVDDAAGVRYARSLLDSQLPRLLHSAADSDAAWQRGLQSPTQTAHQQACLQLVRYLEQFAADSPSLLYPQLANVGSYALLFWTADRRGAFFDAGVLQCYVPSVRHPLTARQESACLFTGSSPLLLARTAAKLPPPTPRHNSARAAAQHVLCTVDQRIAAHDLPDWDVALLTDAVHDSALLVVDGGFNDVDCARSCAVELALNVGFAGLPCLWHWSLARDDSDDSDDDASQQAFSQFRSFLLDLTLNFVADAGLVHVVVLAMADVFVRACASLVQVSGFGQKLGSVVFVEPTGVALDTLRAALPRTLLASTTVYTCSDDDSDSDEALTVVQLSTGGGAFAAYSRSYVHNSPAFHHDLGQLLRGAACHAPTRRLPQPPRLDVTGRYPPFRTALHPLNSFLLPGGGGEALCLYLDCDGRVLMMAKRPDTAQQRHLPALWVLCEPLASRHAAAHQRRRVMLYNVGVGAFFGADVCSSDGEVEYFLLKEPAPSTEWELLLLHNHNNNDDTVNVQLRHAASQRLLVTEPPTFPVLLVDAAACPPELVATWRLACSYASPKIGKAPSSSLKRAIQAALVNGQLLNRRLGTLDLRTQKPLVAVE